MLTSKSIELSDYDELQDGVAAINYAICRTRGQNFDVYVPHEHRYWEYASALVAAKQFGEIKTALDVGCGLTALGPALGIEHGCLVLEIDPDAGMIARREGLGRALGIDLKSETMALKDIDAGRDYDSGFDAVFCISVMEHIPEEDQEISWSALTDAVRPGGLLVVTVDYGRQEKWGEGERVTYYVRKNIEEIVARLKGEFLLGDIDLTYHFDQVNDYTFFRFIAIKDS